VAKTVCGPLTFGLGQKILVPLTCELEVNGWMHDHVDAPSSVCSHECAVTLPTPIHDRTGDSAGVVSDDGSATGERRIEHDRSTARAYL